LVLAGDSAHRRSEELLDALFSVVIKLRDEGPSEAELTKAKQRFAWQMQALLDDPGELAAFLGLGELTGVARTPSERVRTLLAQSREQVQAAARATFTASGLSVAAVGKLSASKRKGLERRVRAFT
jgi:predicted Zn-dependent peptidase